MLNPKMNLLLEQLPESDFRRLLPDLHLVSLVAGQELSGPGDTFEKIIFPVTAAVAISIELSDGSSIETAMIGREGIVGVRALDYTTGLHRIYVAESGFAYGMSRGRLLQEAQTGAAIFKMFLLASLQTMRLISLEMACSNFHTVEQRLAKWVLNRSELSGSNFLQATHQGIAKSLGVRREAVTNSFRKLPGITCERGHIVIHDSALLKNVCCECYFLQKERQANQLTLPFYAKNHSEVM